MKKRKILSLALGMMLLMGTLTACGGGNNAANGGNNAANGGNNAAASSDNGGFVSIATGGTGGTYYPLGGAIATVINNADIGLNANAQATGASIENVQLIHSGDAEIAFIQNDVAYYAYEGTEFFEEDANAPYKDLRGLCCVYPEVVHIVASEESGIKSIEDLAGKKVAVGAPGSSCEVNGRQILEVYGLTYDDLGKADYLSFAEATDQIKNGQIDAAFATTAVPTSSFTELCTTHDVNLLPIDKEKADELIAKYPYYTYQEIHPEEYKGQPETLPVVAVKAMLVVNENMAEDEVYNITKALFEDLESIGEAHARGKDLTLETAEEGMSIPLHPGAQKYFEEVK